MAEFYTYMWLREDGTPYYVGKGKGRRAFRIGSPPQERVLLQEYPDAQSALAAEIFLISYYGRRDLGTGCLRNLTAGGDGLSDPSPEIRRKMREARAKQIPGIKGKKMSPESLKRLSEAHKGQIPWHTGKHWPPEVIEKFRAAKLGKPWSLKRRLAYGKSSSSAVRNS